MSGCRTVVSIANQQEGRHVNIPKKWAHLGRCCPRQSVEILSASSNLNLWNRNKAPTATDMDRKNTQSLASNRPQRSSEPDQQRRWSCGVPHVVQATAPRTLHHPGEVSITYKGFSSQLARGSSERETGIERPHARESSANYRARTADADADGRMGSSPVTSLAQNGVAIDAKAKLTPGIAAQEFQYLAAQEFQYLAAQEAPSMA